MSNCDTINNIRNELKEILNSIPIDNNKIQLFLNKYNIKNTNNIQVSDTCNSSTGQIAFNDITISEKCGTAIENTCNNLFSDSDNQDKCIQKLAPKISGNVQSNISLSNSRCYINNLLPQLKNMADKNTLNLLIGLYQLLGENNDNIDCSNMKVKLENINDLQNVNSCINQTYSMQSNIIDSCGNVQNSLQSNMNSTVNDCIITNSASSTITPLKAQNIKLKPTPTPTPMRTPSYNLYIIIFSIICCIIICCLLFMYLYNKSII